MTEKITVVGGGTGGTVLVNKLSKKLQTEIKKGKVEINLITDNPNHIYKPIFLYVAFGKKQPKEGKRPIKDLVDKKINLDINKVVNINKDDKKLEFEDGGKTDYDYLVLATGSKLAPENTPGLKEDGYHFYGKNGATDLRDTLSEFTKGNLVLSVIGTPHMCPAAPLEFVFIADDWFRKREIRDNIDITYTYPIQRIHAVKSIAEWAKPKFEKRDINFETFFNVESINSEEKVISTMEDKELEYDLLVGIPPHEGDELIKNSGFGEDGWVNVDKNTLQTEESEDIYAIGDTAEVPTSKAGSVAHYEATIVANRLTSRVRGQTPTSNFDGKTLCFIETGLDKASFVSFNYNKEPTVREPSKMLHWAKLAYNESYWLTAKGLL